jgi:hypothetical protein
MAATHGTQRRYVEGCRCDDCKEAHRVSARDYRERRASGQTRPAAVLQTVTDLPPSEPGPVESGVQAEMAGDREIKLDEAAALAELFGLSVDSLLGRKRGPHQDVRYALGALEDAVFTSRNELNRTSKSLRDRLNEIPADFEGYDTLAELVREYSGHLNAANGVLNKLVDRFTDEAAQRATERALKKLKRAGHTEKGPRA